LPNGVPGGGWKAAGTDWLTHEGFAAILRGEAPGPEALVEQKNLWQLEPRVGIKRTQQTRTTAEGALYSPQHLRLGRGVCLGLWAAGLPAETLARIALTPQPVGGESRSAWITMIEQVPMWPALPKQMIQDAQGLQYTVIVLSPLPLQDVPLSGQVISGLPGTLISACMPRALMLGGWDRHQPLPLKPHLAPGTVLFMRTDSAKETTIRGLHGACIGLRPAWGYGLIAIGTWR
jgi:CRISPR-associated protein Cmr3